MKNEGKRAKKMKKTYPKKTWKKSKIFENGEKKWMEEEMKTKI